MAAVGVAAEEEEGWLVVAVAAEGGRSPATITQTVSPLQRPRLASVSFRL
jgi:hypothetical protein